MVSDAIYISSVFNLTKSDIRLQKTKQVTILLRISQKFRSYLFWRVYMMIKGYYFIRKMYKNIVVLQSIMCLIYAEQIAYTPVSRLFFSKIPQRK